MHDERVPGALRTTAGYSLNLLLVAAALVVVALIVVELRLVFVPIALALLLTTLLAPPARWLRRKGWPSALAAASVLLGALLVLGGVFTAIVPVVADQLGALGLGVTQGVERVTSLLAHGPLGVTQAEIDAVVNRVVSQAQENAAVLSTGLLSGALIVGEVLAGTLLTLVLIFFFVKDGERIWGWFVTRFGEQSQHDVHALGTRAFSVLGGYFRGIGIVALADSLLIGLALWLIGVPLVLPLAVLVFLGAFFPIVGALVTGALGVLVALVAKGAFAALLVLGAILLVQQLEGNVLYPLVVGRSLDLHPVAILLGLTAGAIVAGITGALFSVPLLAVLNAWWAYLRERSGGPHDSPTQPRPAAAQEQSTAA